MPAAPVAAGEDTLTTEFEVSGIPVVLRRVTANNVVAANLLAAECRKGLGEVINIAGGKPNTLNQVVAWLNELLEADLPPSYEPPRPADIRHSYASIRKAETLLGYRPHLDIRDGLRRTIEWFKAHEC